jgi:hypothetical protein
MFTIKLKPHKRRVRIMSSEQAEALMESLEQKWLAKQKRDFISRMERKLSHKERMYR